MKKIIPLVIIFFLIVSNLLGQVREELNYYPLHVGDVWQYKITYSPATGNDSMFYMLKRVLADTLLTNGKRYFLVEQPPFTSNKIKNLERVLIRIDSTSGVVYKFLSEQTPEEKIDSLFSKVGDWFFQGRIICAGFFEDTVFSQVRKIRSLRCPTTSSGESFSLDFALNVGVYFQDIYFAFVTAEGNNYRLVYTKMNGKEYGTLVGVNEQEIIPSTYLLSQNYPNPFNPTTKIKYSIPAVETRRGESLQCVALKVFDILGNEIVTLVNEEKLSGNYEVTFNGSNLASGVYFYRLTTRDFSLTKKMILIK